MTPDELREVLSKRVRSGKNLSRLLDRRESRVLRDQDLVCSLKKKLTDASDKRGLVPLLQQVRFRIVTPLLHRAYMTPLANVQAYDTGVLSDKSNMENMMRGMLEGLVRKGRRRYSVAEKSFYASILAYGGPFVHDFVSQNLQGPCSRVSRSGLCPVYPVVPERDKNSA